ncbi:uncharacterized protein LOC109851631 [Pseudomyrmex gracilis]|uniref:uncharacterized protein LOC109851631 n=1 Tax=Pseudomyrmex gracilis TaxID=219809 RepID=UPI0009954AD3|nr:uncharacterized protein LOC109851631 [Pseudomyrmex gracilis]
MNKNICDEHVIKKPPVLQNSNINDQSPFKVPYPVAAKKSKSNNNSIDYKNIAFTISGEISSPSINRNTLFAQKPPVFFVEDAEDNDDQFVSNMKKIIDENCQMERETYYGVRDLQTKSYATRKKKCAFTDEDQNLMKRFKRSIDESKALRVIPRKSPQSENVTCSTSSCATMTNSPQVTDVANTVHTNSGDNQLLYQKTSVVQKNHNLTGLVPQTLNIVTEVEQMIYCEMQVLTPPQETEFDD